MRFVCLLFLFYLQFDGFAMFVNVSPSATS